MDNDISVRTPSRCCKESGDGGTAVISVPDAVRLNGGKRLDSLTPAETPDTVPGCGPFGSVVRASASWGVEEASIPRNGEVGEQGLRQWSSFTTGVGGAPTSGAAHTTFQSTHAIGYCVGGATTPEIQWSFVPPSAEPGPLPSVPAGGAFSGLTCVRRTG